MTPEVRINPNRTKRKFMVGVRDYPIDVNGSSVVGRPVRKSRI
jgi:hypothetical protein